MARELIGPALPPGFPRCPEADPDEDFTQGEEGAVAVAAHQPLRSVAFRPLPASERGSALVVARVTRAEVPNPRAAAGWRPGRTRVGYRTGKGIRLSIKKGWLPLHGMPVTSTLQFVGHGRFWATACWSVI